MRKNDRPWRVGHVYTYFEGLACFDYPCVIAGREDHECCHSCCCMAALRAAGKEDVAAQLEANGIALDWLSNWGKMVYDPAEHGRDLERRTLAASIVRKLRRRAVSPFAAVVSGCWIGALLPK